MLAQLHNSPLELALAELASPELASPELGAAYFEAAHSLVGFAVFRNCRKICCRLELLSRSLYKT